MHPDDLEPGLPPAERDGLLRLAAQLDEARPTPPAGFRGELGRAVAVDAQRRHLRPRPPQLWLTVAALTVVGLVLLLVAATQV